jgi:hypothetical protein
MASAAAYVCGAVTGRGSSLLVPRPVEACMRAVAFMLVCAGVVVAVGAQEGGQPGGTTATTFTEHVAPILYANCTSCHRPGEAAPFTLLHYEDARQRGRLLAAVAAARVMPPWKAAPGDYPFLNERRLDDEAIAVLQRWVADGMPEGDPQHLPPRPAFTEGWELGPPDLVVSMVEPFPVPAEGRDIYRNFVLPLGLEEDRWLRAIDFRPSARAVVHHSLFFADVTGTARQRDAADPRPGFAGAMGGGVGLRGGGGGLAALLGFGGPAGRAGGGTAAGDVAAFEALGSIGGTLGGWALGGRAQQLPDGLAFFVPAGADLVLSTHFHPSGRPEQEQSTVGLYFSDRPPTHAFAPLQLPPLFGILEGLDIPPGEARYTMSDAFVLPADVEAFGVSAHAHYLGREMRLTATFPDGTERTLLHIDNWDFAWQEGYRFEDYVALPRGTRLEATITYDNSGGNPRNPSVPPVRVRWGEQSTDEMGSMTLQLVAPRPEDLRLVQEAYVAHVRMAALTRPGLAELLQRGLGGRGRGALPRR